VLTIILQAGKNQELGRDEVAAFLRNCVPAMDHFLDAFINFGCRNRKFLEGLAQYDDDEIEEFLRKIMRRSMGKMTEMDVWFLKKDLKRSFTG
jgi:hypothetical protein